MTDNLIATATAASASAASVSETDVPTWAEVDLEQLAANRRLIDAHVGQAQVMAVIKANAYGHGLVPVAQHLAQTGTDWLAVARVAEGQAIRDAGVATSTLVFGEPLPGELKACIQHDLSMTVSSIATLDAVSAAASDLGRAGKVHLKIDTGMGRLGAGLSEAHDLLAASLATPDVTIEGIYSHFANADSSDRASSQRQLDVFLQVLDFYSRRGIQPPIRHISNSGSILALPDANLDMVRAGLLLYGVSPNTALELTVPVEPVLSWTARVLSCKQLPAGHPVGYGSTWHAPVDTHVAVVSVGYGDGYHRGMSHRGSVLIDGRRYPVVGRICMDLVMVDLGTVPVAPGSEVQLLGSQPCPLAAQQAGVGAATPMRTSIPGESDEPEVLTAGDLAEWAGTIPWEILTSIGQRVPRRYRRTS